MFSCPNFFFLFSIFNNPFLLTLQFSEESVIETGPDLPHDVSFKVIVIGDSGVGKSNMLNRWIKGCFGSETIIATTQCAFHQKTFKMKAKDGSEKDRIVAVRLWDTGVWF
jgi:GTPase SAR1 family protein